MLQFRDKTKKIVIVVTRSKWHEPPRIRHQLARQLSRWYNVLYFESSPGKLEDMTEEKINKSLFVIRYNNKSFVFIYKILNKIPLIRVINGLLFAKKVHKSLSLGDLNHYPLLLFNFDFDNYFIMQNKYFKLKLYICNDDFPERQSNKILRSIYSKLETSVSTKADLCFCVSYALLEKIKNYNNNSYLLLPGHEFKTSLNNINFPSRTKSKINVCFMGYINSRIQFEWLEKVSEHSKINLTLLGPVQGDEATRFIEKENVTYIQPQQGGELQKVMERQDVFLLPYRKYLQQMHNKNLLVSTLPNKTMAYLAIGKPIVVCGRPGLKYFPQGLIEMPQGFVYHGINIEEFIGNIIKAFEEDTVDLCKKRIDYAMGRTWDKIGEEIKGIIDKQLCDL